MKLRRIIKTIYVLLLALMLTGCGGSGLLVTLEYTPSMSPASDVAEFAKHTVYVAQPVDQRPDKSCLAGGDKSVHYVRTEQDIRNWVGNAITLELQSCGFQAKRISDPNSISLQANDILVETNITKLFADAKQASLGRHIGEYAMFTNKNMYWDIVVNIDISAEIHANGKMYSKEYKNAKVKDPGFWRMNWANAYKETFEEALSELVKVLVDDVVNVTKGGPL